MPIVSFYRMVKHQAARLNATFAALSDPTRRAILKRLASGSASMGDLAQPFGMTWPAVTKHVKALERARLVKRVRDGRVHTIHLQARPMRAAQQWLDDYQMFWEERFDALDRLLEEQPR